MPSIKKFGNDYYLCTTRKLRSGAPGLSIKRHRKQFMVKFTDRMGGKVDIGTFQVYFPNELIGKKIRLKVEVQE